MAGLMNMVSRLARSRGGAGRPTTTTRGTAPGGPVGGPVGGTGATGRRGGQAAMAEGLVRRFMRRGR